jgi:hypothetical protein
MNSFAFWQVNITRQKAKQEYKTAPRRASTSGNTRGL